MSRSDVEAVAARRASLISELAKLERTRLQLLEEDEDLEVAERVLRRLGALRYGEPAAIAPPSPAHPLHALLAWGLSSGRKALERVRSAVARPTN